MTTLVDLLNLAAETHADLSLWSQHTPNARGVLVAWAAARNFAVTQTCVGERVPYMVYEVAPNGDSAPTVRVYERVERAA